MRLAIITGMWKRHDVFECFAEGIHQLQAEVPEISIEVFVSGSEGPKSASLAKEHGFFYIETPNQPLSQKMNRAAGEAKYHNPDYCLMMGSDDIISPDLLREYLIYMKKGTDYIYITDGYFFDRTTKLGLYWGGYDKPGNYGHASGLGRMISSRLMGVLGWQPWSSGNDGLLDTAMDLKLKSSWHTKKGINIKEKGLFALDIKGGDTQMTPFVKWPNSSYLPGEQMLYDNLPPDLAKLVYGKEDNFIHHSAIVDPGVILGEGNVIMEGTIIRNGVVIGDNNYVGPYCIIGDAPEKIGFFDRPFGVWIGNNNRFCKKNTIDSGTERLTLIGDNVIMLSSSHLGHDVIVNDNVTLSCNVAIGGWCEIGKGCNFGLGAVAHQRLIVPSGCMIGMNSTLTKKTDLSQPNKKLVGSPARIIGDNIR